MIVTIHRTVVLTVLLFNIIDGKYLLVEVGDETGHNESPGIVKYNLIFEYQF